MEHFDRPMHEVRSPSPSATQVRVEKNSNENPISEAAGADENTIRERRLRALNIPNVNTSEQTTPNPTQGDLAEDTQPPPNPTVFEESEAEQ